MTKREELVLAVLSTAGEEAWTPVQVQKIFFLLDREAAHLLDGPHWSFQPYDYGAYDATVYRELEGLARAGFVQVENPPLEVRRFRLTEDGARSGAERLRTLPSEARSYVQQMSNWVRSLTFQQLVSAVYKRHPDTKAKSIFRE